MAIVIARTVKITIAGAVRTQYDQKSVRETRRSNARFVVARVIYMANTSVSNASDCVA